MFVNSINIREFRGIKKCKRPITLSNFTVLMGRNNSGKSTVLEALSLLPFPDTAEYITDEKKIDFLCFLHKKGFSSLSKVDSLVNYKNLIYLYDGFSEIEYKKKNKEPFKIIISKKGAGYGFEQIDKKNRTFDYKTKGRSPNAEELKVLNFFEIHKSRRRNCVFFFPYDTEYLRRIDKKIDSFQNLITKNGIHNKVAKSLSKCVDDEYSEVMFNPIRLRKILPNTTPYIRISDLGLGAEKLVKIMILVEVMNPKLILIDDFEIGLHPTMLDLFLQWLTGRKCQVILSSHSIDLLYRLTDIEPKDISVLSLKKSHDDIFDYNILSLDEIEDYLNANTDPRKFDF